MPPDQFPAPPRRADAERNRDKILAAARSAFADPEADISMAEISRRAGVGMATLYRNFPGRRELLEALYTDEVTAGAADGTGDGSAGAEADGTGDGPAGIIEPRRAERPVWMGMSRGADGTLHRRDAPPTGHSADGPAPARRPPAPTPQFR